jgi:amino acid transporter
MINPPMSENEKEAKSFWSIPNITTHNNTTNNSHSPLHQRKSPRRSEDSKKRFLNISTLNGAVDSVTPSYGTTVSSVNMSSTQSEINDFGHSVNNQSEIGIDTSSPNRNDSTNNGDNAVHSSNNIGSPESYARSSSADGTGFTSSSASLGKATLAVMVFYSVSGGPFGVESAVRSGGYLYTLLGFIIGPLIWSAQEALMTAELACVFPESSGGMAWVEEAFGPMAGWMAGYLGWMAGATDNAIYPVLFLDYLLQVLGNTSDGQPITINPILRFVGLGVTSIALSYINWLGLDIVGQMSVTICVIAMSPFVLMTLIGAFQIDFSKLFEFPDPNEQLLLYNVTDDDTGGGFFPDAGLATTGILWRPFLNNLFWNLNSFDAAASFSADVGNQPERVIPPAMIYAVIMVSVSYILPLIVAIGATSSQPYQWDDGYLATIAGQIAGPWLEGWTVLAAGISNIAMFQAELSADAFQLMGMADRGHVPKIFGHRSRHGTPTYGIILGTIIIVAMGSAGLDKLIEMLNFNYSISLLMEFTAFIKLRISQPNLHRPWRIPFGTTGCILFFLPTYFFILLILALSNYESIIFSVCTNLFGIFIYLWRNGLHRISWSCLCRGPSAWILYTPAFRREDDDDIDTSTGRDGLVMVKTTNSRDNRANEAKSDNTSNWDNSNVGAARELKSASKADNDQNQDDLTPTDLSFTIT